MIKNLLISSIIVFLLVWIIVWYYGHIIATGYQSSETLNTSFVQYFILIFTASVLILDMNNPIKMKFKYTFWMTLISFYISLNLFSKLHVIKMITG